MEYAEHPRFHFSPPQGWTNDPNGTVYFGGEYHLFYQHHPDSLQWGPMHWGHAVSKDLLNWEHLPIALYPDDLGMIFSGSCAVDTDNTSGFGSTENPPMVAAYTNHSEAGEVQSIAWSLDHGRTWQKYTGNPVIAEPELKDFRDPRLFYHKQMASWVMVVASGDRARFYRSANCKDWQYAGEFGPVAALEGSVWECPDLFELPFEEGTAWVLSLSLTAGPSSRNRVVTFTGSFDGTAFVPFGEPVQVEVSRDFYAPITFSGAEGRTVWIGWMNCWEYAGVTPAEGWRGMMTLPRELSLRRINGSICLHQQPVKEFQMLPRQQVLYLADVALRQEQNFNVSDLGERFEISCIVEKCEGSLHIRLSECLRLTFDFVKGMAGIERLAGAHACSHTVFTGEKMETPLGRVGSFDVKIIADGSAVEVFIDEGRIVYSVLIFPLNPNSSLTVQVLDSDCLIKGFQINKLTL